MHCRIAALLLLLIALVSIAPASDRPNILWLSIEDASPNLGCYGDQHARTPNVDAFASESILYENAFVSAPVCAPCRSSIITGVYATSLGTHHMRSTVKLPPEIRPFTMHLRDGGYYCTNNSKEDYQFKTPKGTWNESSGKAHWRNRPNDEQPFFAVFNYTGTHESAVRGDQPKYDRMVASLSMEERHDPATLELPPYYPDTPKVRQEWAQYYNCMTAMDKWFGKKLQELLDAGLADDTIVFFWSDHGVGLPRGKRWLYDSGIHVPFIVHVPEKWRTKFEVDQRAGTRTDELVSLIDLPPTVLHLAGLAIPTYMQGRAFLGDNLLPEREYIYAARDRMDERYDMIRCVRTKRYKYIRNFMPWRPYTQWVSYGEQSSIMQELRLLQAEGKLTDEQALFMRDEKPVEELYDLQNDPHEMNNLVQGSTTFGSTVENFDHSEAYLELADKLPTWMYEMKDLGILPESVIDSRGKIVGTRYGIFHRLVSRTSHADHYDLLMAATQFSRPAVARTHHAVNADWISADNPALAWFVRLLADKPLALGERLPTLSQQPMPARVVACEALCNSVDHAKAVSTLLNALENAESPWDRLQAANVIDLLPDFDAHADQLRPVVERVSEALPMEINTGPVENRQGLGYVKRCVERFAERLNL
jgi:arylsulfatase A-like enzyme